MHIHLWVSSKLGTSSLFTYVLFMFHVPLSFEKNSNIHFLLILMWSSIYLWCILLYSVVYLTLTLTLTLTIALSLTFIKCLFSILVIYVSFLHVLLFSISGELKLCCQVPFKLQKNLSAIQNACSAYFDIQGLKHT